VNTESIFHHMIDYREAKIDSIILHRIGNPTLEEPLELSDNRLPVPQHELSDALLTHFLSPFSRTAEFFKFNDKEPNFLKSPAGRLTHAFFQDNMTFQDFSCGIAQKLYEASSHPQIKSGDLFVVHFTHILIDQTETNAVGFFKSEIKHPFITLDNTFENLRLQLYEGIAVDTLDKGCVVFNIYPEEGYKLCSVDKVSKNPDYAHFWNNEFLHVLPFEDAFLLTSNYMSMTKAFVADKLPEEFHVSKPDQIDLLNRSAAYFKDNHTFTKETFEEDVLGNEEIIRSFRHFNDDYQQQHQVQFEPIFEISPGAVQKQSKFFKSILKLDKNFHVYIHGNRDMIEKGVDENGRKFYKLFFDSES